MANSGTINPNLFAPRWRKFAEAAKNADLDHTARIKGTVNKQEIASSFKESINSWKKLITDRVTLGQTNPFPDGGMRHLAKSRGRC